MACRRQPVSCREHDLAERYGLTPNALKFWQFEGKCPLCHHGGFSLSAPSQAKGPEAWRHWWHCNCHRCKCDPLLAAEAMLADGISEDCLGGYLGYLRAHRPRESGEKDEAAKMRDALRGVLADSSIRALADLKIRVLEVIEGEAPKDFREFIAFARRAGVPRVKCYEAAQRWGRRQQQ